MSIETNQPEQVTLQLTAGTKGMLFACLLVGFRFFVCCGGFLLVVVGFGCCLVWRVLVFLILV